MHVRKFCGCGTSARIVCGIPIGCLQLPEPAHRGTRWKNVSFRVMYRTYMRSPFNVTVSYLAILKALFWDDRHLKYNRANSDSTYVPWRCVSLLH